MRASVGLQVLVAATLLASCASSVDGDPQGGPDRGGDSTPADVPADSDTPPPPPPPPTTTDDDPPPPPPPADPVPGEHCPDGVIASEPSSTPPTLTEGVWKNISPPGSYRPNGSKPSYGLMDIRLDPCNTAIMYITSDSQGLFKSTNAGASWTTIGGFSGTVSPGDMQINPVDGRDIYTVGGVRGDTPGFWVSHDAGATFDQPDGFVYLSPGVPASNATGGWTNDVYDVAADPADFDHVLVTFHAGFEWTGNAGVIESHDGGDTWTRHWPIKDEDGDTVDLGNGHGIAFLRDSDTWLLTTQYAGMWRTTDGGEHFRQVSTVSMQHGGMGIYYAKNDVLYVGSSQGILRSENNGQSFELIRPDGNTRGYYAVMGDGNHLYAQHGDTGNNSVGMNLPYMISDEDDGRTWTTFTPTQTFSDGPYRMTFDAVNRILYSANWNEGAWALKVSTP